MYRISNIIFAIFAIAIGVLWYQDFRLYPYRAPGQGATVEVVQETKGISINDARKISTLKLDFTLFDDSVYKNLRFRVFSIQDVSSIPHGRVNPFAGQPFAGVK